MMLLPQKQWEPVKSRSRNALNDFGEMVLHLKCLATQTSLPTCEGVLDAMLTEPQHCCFWTLVRELSLA